MQTCVHVILHGHSISIKPASNVPRVALILDSAVMAHMLGVAAVEEGAEPHRIDSNTPYLMDRLVELGPRVVVVRRTLDHGDGLTLCKALRAHPR